MLFEFYTVATTQEELDDFLSWETND
jgi:hypothetical protein